LLRFISIILIGLLAAFIGCGNNESPPPSPPEVNDNSAPEPVLVTTLEPVTPKPEAPTPKEPVPPEIPEIDEPTDELTEFNGDPVHDGCKKVMIRFEDEIRSEETYTYNRHWRLKGRELTSSDADASFRFDYTYNEKGLLATMASSHSGKETFVHKYQYDDQDRLTEHLWDEHVLSRPSKQAKLQHEQRLFYKQTYAYDSEGRLIGDESFINGKKHLSGNYQYNSNAQISSCSWVSKAVTQIPDSNKIEHYEETYEAKNYFYTEAGRLDKIKIQRIDKTKSLNDFKQIQYHYENGRLLGEEHTGPDSKENVSISYSYDDKGRLTETTSTTSKGKETSTYSYN